MLPAFTVNPPENVLLPPNVMLPYVSTAPAPEMMALSVLSLRRRTVPESRTMLAADTFELGTSVAPPFKYNVPTVKDPSPENSTTPEPETVRVAASYEPEIVSAASPVTLIAVSCVDSGRPNVQLAAVSKARLDSTFQVLTGGLIVTVPDSASYSTVAPERTVVPSVS